MAKKPKLERARAAERLALDGTLLPLADLTSVSGHSRWALYRFGTEGKGGVFLDVIKHPTKGWLSSAAAVQRFQRAYMQRKGGRVV